MGLTLRPADPPYRRTQYLAAILVGGVGGALLLLTSRASLIWSAGLVLAVAALAVGAVTGRARGPVLALLAFCIPLHFDNYFAPFPMNSAVSQYGYLYRISASDLALAVLLLLWLGEMSRRHDFQVRLYPSVMLPALLFFTLALVSASVAQEPRLSFYQLTEFIKGLLIFFCLSNCVRDQIDLRWTLAGLLVAVLFECSLGLYQSIAGKPFGLAMIGDSDLAIRQMLGERLVIRPTGTFWHTNALSMYLGMTMPVIAGLILAPSKRSAKLIAAVVILVGLVTLAYTLSRGAWIGVCLAGILLLAFGLRKKVILPLHVVLGLIAVSVMVILLNLIMEGALFRRLTGYDGGSAQTRIPLMRGALAVVADHPLFGSGLNNYAGTIQLYDSSGEFTQFGTLPVVHNVFLLFAAETGLLGLGAFLWFLIALGVRGVRYLRLLKEGTPRGGLTMTAALTAGLLAGGLSLIAHNMVDVALIGDGQLFAQFWFLAGLLVVVTVPHAIASRSQEPAKTC